MASKHVPVKAADFRWLSRAAYMLFHVDLLEIEIKLMVSDNYWPEFLSFLLILCFMQT